MQTAVQYHANGGTISSKWRYSIMQMAVQYQANGGAIFTRQSADDYKVLDKKYRASYSKGALFESKPLI